MQYSENYHMNRPELADQYNLSHWNENTDIVDTQLKANADAISAETTRATNAETALQNITNENLKIALLNFCYPVGSLYWSSNSANPSTLFGGTWIQIKDRFVWAKGDSDTVDSTGGAKTVTLTKENLPSHNHNMQHYHSRGQMEITGKISNSGGSFGVTGFNSSPNSFTGAFTGSETSGAVYMGQQNTSACKVVTFTASKTWTGRTSGAYASQTNSDTTTKTVTGNTGSGTAVDKMPPYVIKYCWERTA